MKRLSAGSAAFAAAGGFVLLYAAVLSFFIRLPSGLLLTALTGVALLLTGVFYTRLKKRKWPLGLLCAAFARRAGVYAVSCAVRPARHGVL